jgi:hypothetical protein
VQRDDRGDGYDRPVRVQRDDDDDNGPPRFGRPTGFDFPRVNLFGPND